jgi:hypothetical protein
MRSLKLAVAALLAVVTVGSGCYGPAYYSRRPVVYRPYVASYGHWHHGYWHRW